MNDYTTPLFPIYIPSKGRWKYGQTMKALDKMNVKYNIVVERQEYDEYSRFFPRERLLILDETFQDEYETLDFRGSSFSKGSGPARNFAMYHAKEHGFNWYWCLDDNIRCFSVHMKNRIYDFANGKFFRYMEEFVLRYTNIAMAGPQYEMFVPKECAKIPITLNTTIFSCNLINIGAGFKWRGRYNEDAILSLDMLTRGWCTVKFNDFLQQKTATQTTPGGNTSEMYKNGTIDKSRLLFNTYPQFVKKIIKYGRPHHQINRKLFTQKLVKASDYEERVQLGKQFALNLRDARSE